MRTILFVFIALYFPTILFAQQTRLNLTDISEYGRLHKQRAYRVPGQVVWMDRSLIEAKRPQVVGLSDEELKRQLVHEFCLLTERQLALRGTFISDFSVDLSQPQIVNHPGGYKRAAVREWGFPVDIKGSGWGSEGYEAVAFFLRVYELLKAERSPTEIEQQILSRQIHELKKVNEATLRSFSKEEAKISRSNDFNKQAQANSIHHFMQNHKIQQRLLVIADDALNGRRSPNQADHFLAGLRMLDYFNGVFAAPRAVNEIATQRAIQAIFKERSVPNYLEFDTVKNYFMIVPNDIGYYDTSGGLHPIAIVGREADWRGDGIDDSWSNGIHNFFPIDPVLAGGLQLTSQQRLVDFEIPSVTDNRVSDLLAYGWDDAQPKIEKLARVALAQDKGGDHEAIARLITAVDIRMQDYRPSPIVESTEIISFSISPNMSTEDFYKTMFLMNTIPQSNVMMWLANTPPNANTDEYISRQFKSIIESSANMQNVELNFAISYALKYQQHYVEAFKTFLTSYVNRSTVVSSISVVEIVFALYHHDPLWLLQFFSRNQNKPGDMGKFLRLVAGVVIAEHLNRAVVNVGTKLPLGLQLGTVGSGWMLALLAVAEQRMQPNHFVNEFAGKLDPYDLAQGKIVLEQALAMLGLNVVKNCEDEISL